MTDQPNPTAAADTTTAADPIDRAEAALKEFSAAWREAMSDSTPENLERVDLAFELSRKAESEAERAKNIAERQTSLYRQDFRL